VPRKLLRVDAGFRTLQIQKADAFRLHGPPAVLRDVG
jgi:hypothetical protein